MGGNSSFWEGIAGLEGEAGERIVQRRYDIEQSEPAEKEMGKVADCNRLLTETINIYRKMSRRA